MNASKPIIKAGSLKTFSPFADLPPEYVIIAANFAEQITIADGDTVLEENSEDSNDYYLVDGELTVRDIYGANSTMASGTPEAEQPLPQLRPSAYRIHGNGPATLLKVPQEVIRRVRAEAPEKDTEVEDDVTLDITQSREFFNDFKEELQMNRVRLPSLALSASRVHRLLGGKNVSDAELIAAISMDPAIAAKLLKMANSSLFNLEEKVEDLDGIVERLGIFATREIAACFAFRDVYKNTLPELERRLQVQVSEARQVSAMAAAIAELSDDVNPNVAALAGLLHNVGVLPIFSYSMQNVAYAMKPDLVDHDMNYPPLNPPFRVMIVDDHKFVVELLAQRLSVESKVEIVGMANRGSAALHIAKTEKVDIVLLDMELEQEDGIHVARSLLEIDPAIRIVGLSTHDTDHHPISLLEMGGLGYISKSATGREIVDGITRVAAGEMAISPKIAVHLATQQSNPNPIGQIRSLSPKEHEVLILIAEGFSIKEIAEKLSVVEKTIQSHRAQLRKKLNVNTDVELCLISIKSGLISIQRDS